MEAFKADETKARKNKLKGTYSKNSIKATVCQEILKAERL